jgi:hypothetical protein
MVIGITDITFLILHCLQCILHVRWVLCHHNTAGSWVVNEEALWIWSTAENKLYNKLKTADKEWSSSLLVGWEANKVLL